MQSPGQEEVLRWTAAMALGEGAEAEEEEAGEEVVDAAAEVVRLLRMQEEGRAECKSSFRQRLE